MLKMRGVTFRSKHTNASVWLAWLAKELVIGAKACLFLEVKLK